MTRRAVIAVLVVASTMAACGPRRVSGPSRGRELVVLLPDPDGAGPGRAVVTSASTAVDLASGRDATQVIGRRPPTPAAPLDEARIQQLFGDALATLPPAPKSFNLYFLFDSDELTTETRALLPEILRVVKERPVPDVVAIGHTDTTGTAASNYQLGLRRATRVRDLLVAAGLDAALISITSAGEGEPLIATPDETAEPRNRRVEIAVR